MHSASRTMGSGKLSLKRISLPLLRFRGAYLELRCCSRTRCRALTDDDKRCPLARVRFGVRLPITGQWRRHPMFQRNSGCELA